MPGQSLATAVGNNGTIVRTTTGGIVSVRDSHTGNNAAPHGFILHQNYPNPFNPSTTIGYEIPSTGRVVLRIYDILGKETASLVDGIKPAGAYSVRWNAGAIASGVYFARLEAGGRVEMGKLILMK